MVSKYEDGKGLHSSIFTTFSDEKNAAIHEAAASLVRAIMSKGITADGNNQVDETTIKPIVEAAANTLRSHGERVCMPHYEESEYGAPPAPCFLEAKCMAKNCPLRMVVFEENVRRRPVYERDRWQWR